MSSNNNKWTFAADRGGTFTDILGIDPNGQFHQEKILSESALYEDSVLEGIRRVLKKNSQNYSEKLISEIRVGTTICTNALLERKGSKIGLLITSGFKDLITIGDQTRPDIFSLWIEKPKPLYQRSLEIRERINFEGKVETPLDISDIEKAIEELKTQGILTVVTLFMHSWKNPSHEKQAAKIIKDNGFSDVICSHEVLPLIKMVTRGQTALVDGYLSSLLLSYIKTLKTQIGKPNIHFMTSSGGLVDSKIIRAKDSILSGPAGGAVAVAAISDQLGIRETIGFDMGGTSTDVCRYDGELEHISETELAGIKYQTDQLDVETVAAGGGSILGFDGQKTTVGPQSAGSYPGPACYGNGGPLTITDANLILGRLFPENMPINFGSSGIKGLNIEVAYRSFKSLTKTINKKTNECYTPEILAEGYIAVANEAMCRVIRKISIAKGYDIRKHTLICFGSAAAQHVCSIAKSLKINKIIIHPLAGILSAYGIAIADKTNRKAMAIMEVLTENLLSHLDDKFNQLESEIYKSQFQNQFDSIRIDRYLDMRPLGSDTYLTIKVTDVNKIYPIREQFIKSYKKRFGFYPENSEIEVVNIRTEVSKIGLGRFYENIFSGSFKKTKSKPKPDKFKKVFFSGSWIKTPVFYRKTLNPNFIISGPAVIVDDFTTVIVEPGFTGSFNQAGHLEILAANIIKSKTSEKRDPILLEIFNHRFMSIAEQMGYTLANSAHSINIKERLDFSCAIFDARGELVANAQHIPVHIGSMGDSVKTVLSQNKNTLKKGDVFLINNPHNGGSHLPDITAVSPVIINNKLVFFVATRGHHSDIGGITPGSMSSTATTLEEEGVVIDKFLLVRDGAFFQEEISTLLSSGLYPARNIPERVSDLRAQCAANAKGIQILEQLVDEMSLNVVTAYMQHIQDNATEAMEEALNIFLGNKKIYNKKFIDTLDGGQKICVEIIISRSDNRCRIKIDFSGTSSEIKENLNTPSSVVKSAVLYVLRTLIMKNIPLNSGCFRPVDIIIPKDSLLNPSSTAAVAGGNVETSQRIVDVLYGALELTAASQGTMNNFTFGLPDGSGKQYYETIAGGSGATNGHHGASAVQVHMTNTRITDPEVLEQRFPDIRIEKFAIRKNSGGDGKWIGGDGVERAIRFLKTMKVSLLTERRVFPPYGMKYGNPGKIGKNILIQEDGQEIKMDGTEEQTINPGEKIVIKTPGGGGYGKRT